ncbi:MAG TPA: phenylalanine--tRNA ligase subunit alpha, partial [candidate division Zixibacteria bacterium]|nr:phenylalanine--tRNA ligase subunit alpha [candidate division Zixibacteria bacterium]
MIDRLEKIRGEALDALKSASSQADLDEIRAKYLGRKGELADIMSSLGTLSKEERPVVGKESNRIKNELEGEFKKRLDEIKSGATSAKQAVPKGGRWTPKD